MTEPPLDQQFRRLWLVHMAGELEAVLAAAAKDNLAHRDVLDRLVDIEIAAATRTASNGSSTRPGFPPSRPWTLSTGPPPHPEGFDFERHEAGLH